MARCVLWPLPPPAPGLPLRSSSDNRRARLPAPLATVLFVSRTVEWGLAAIPSLCTGCNATPACAMGTNCKQRAPDRDATATSNRLQLPQRWDDWPRSTEGGGKLCNGQLVAAQGSTIAHPSCSFSLHPLAAQVAPSLSLPARPRVFLLPSCRALI
jgi:hypothetical protein